MADVRSQTLAALRITSTASVVAFSVPPNTVVLLKGIAAYNAGGVAGDIYIATQTPALAVYVAKYTLQPNTATATQIWVALNPSQACTVQITASAFNVWLSGAVLAGGPPYPVMPTGWDFPLPDVLPKSGDTRRRRVKAR
jgi:hypothetical protein